MTFKHTTNTNITSYSKELSILIQVIKPIGKNKTKDHDIEKLANLLKTSK
ncbi:DUF6088 family protein [Ureaplasma diversum]